MRPKRTALDDLIRPLETGYGKHFDAEYNALPEAIKMQYSPKEWAWLGWEHRQHVVDRECLPEVPED